MSIDFEQGLLNSQGKTVIMVVVDKLSKQAHFIALEHLFTATIIAQLFLDNIFKLYGILISVISNRDKILLSSFWKELFKLLGTEFNFSTSYHLQTEVINRTLETYLRCMIGERPKDWMRWLPLVEYWYYTSFYIVSNTTPYQEVYDRS